MRALPSSFGRSVVFSICFTLAAVLGTTFLTQSAAAQEQPQLVVATPRPLITEALDESRLMVLKGNTHPLARREFDLGTAPASLPMERMLLVLKRSDEQETALRKLLDDQQDKNSPHYHKWVTPEQFGAQFGPTDGDMQMITSWLQSHGFQVGSTKGRTVLEFSGSASQVKEAFHTSIHKYVVHGEQHWANANDPSIPAALAPAVAGIKTLHNFLKKPMVHMAEKYVPAKLVAKSRPEFTSGSGLHALTPDDYRVIYNSMNSPFSGLGVTIAVVGRSNLFNGGQDVSDFRNVFGVAGGGNGLTIILNGPDPGDIGDGDELEATLDASWSGALAPSANIDFVVSGSTNTTDGIDLSELYIIENNLGAIMTESFGICEANVTPGDAQGISLLAEQAAAQGITYMVSAGDTGAAGCDNLGETTAVGGISINVLASNPFTVAMGGTLFNEHGQDATYWGTTNGSALGSALAYIPEDAWNETCTTQCQQGQPPLAAGSGGASIYFQKPPWQSGVTGTSSDTVRDIPDISLTSAGHDFYLLCLQASCVPDSQGFVSFAGVLGTSAAAPSFASVMALVDQSQGGPQGVANYVLYPLALAQQTAGTKCDASNTSTPPNSACVFNDVTSGNISVPGEAGYPSGVYAAAAGYDMATGLGSVNVANLVTAWASAKFNATTTTLTLNGVSTPITIAHGASVAVGGKVTSNSTTPTGDVALMAAIGPSGSLTNQTGVAEFLLGSGGVISGTTTQLPGGTYMVTARYAGNGTFAASTSAGIQVTVNQEASTTSISGLDPNGLPLAGGTYPFGSVIFVRADVVGASGHGTPSGAVTFTDTFGALPSLNPQISPPVAVPNPSPLNSGGNTSVGDGIISFDAGNHSIAASYGGDSSFNTSQSSGSAPVTFTIQPGFAGVSRPTDVSITSPGLSGTSTVGVITSSNFTTAISFTCSGLPAEATCSAASATGQGPTTVVNTNIIVSTMGPHTVMLRGNEPRVYYAVLLGGGLPFGIFFVGASRRRRWSILALMMLLALLVAVPACGGGGSSHHQDPGTPIGTYTVTVTATAGSLSQQGSFTLVVQ
jgi:subtilase family serine protease